MDSFCASPCSNGSLRDVEQDFLHVAGFVVKNTFIDDVPVASDDVVRRLRRANTAPCQELEKPSVWDSEHSGVVGETMSETSTSSPDSDTDTVSDAMSAHGEEESLLSLVVMRECAFLRISSVCVVSLQASQR